MSSSICQDNAKIAVSKMDGGSACRYLKCKREIGTMRNSKIKLLVESFGFTILFYLLANGYNFFHQMHAGDSLFMVYQNDAAWEISLGRFIQPFLVSMRGGLTPPFLISVLSMLWLSLSLYLVMDFLEIRKLPSVILTASVMTCNITILSLNATFLPYLDFYVFALFLAVFGVWLMKRETAVSFVLGSLSLSASLGIYQSYICVSIALMMIYFLYRMPQLQTFGAACKKILKYAAAFLAAAVVYYGMWKLFQAVFHIGTADSYNGLASLGDYSEISIGNAIVAAYRNVLNYFVYPEVFVTNTFRGVPMSLFWRYLLRLCNLAVVTVGLFALVRTNLKHRTSPWQRILQLMIVVLFPIGINFVCILSKGMEHSLMIYAFNFVYIMAIKITEKEFLDSGNTAEKRKGGMPWKVVLAALMLLYWSNVVYSNQAYLKKDFQESAAQSLLTRIVYKIESTEGYVPGVTPVGISGNFESSPCIAEAGPLGEIVVYGMGKTALTYPADNYAFLSYVLNMNMNLVVVNSEDEAIREMPVYPAEGSVAYVEGTLVVKVSE